MSPEKAETVKNTDVQHRNL